jgi:hypothetical protein
MPPKSATGAKKKPAKKALALKEAAVKEVTAKSSAQKAALGKRTTRDKEKHTAVTATHALTPAAEDHQDHSPALTDTVTNYPTPEDYNAEIGVLRSEY